MITYWQIYDTKKQVSDGLIIEVTYGCIAQIDNQIDRIVDTILIVGDALDPNFIPYQLLTEEIVINWVKTTLGAEQVADIETTVQNNITAYKEIADSQTVKSGLPWRQ